MDVNMILQIIQIITVPITLIITFFSFKKVVQSQMVSKELQKAQYTNDFVLSFKKIYAKLQAVAVIKY